jgi:hypothetical protein
MPTKRDFDSNPLPLFLAEPEPSIGKVWTRAVLSSRVLKASILLATATAIGIAILSVGNPVTLLANVTASLVDKSVDQRSPDQWAPAIQSTVQALPPTAQDAPTRDQIAAAFESVGQSQTENTATSSEALMRQFQAWAAEKDAQAQVAPVQSVQDAPAQVAENARAQIAENARAPLRPMQKHRVVRLFHTNSTHAEIRPVQNRRKTVRREQNARVQVPPAQDVRAQGQSVQNAQVPSFLQTFGQRN